MALVRAANENQIVIMMFVQDREVPKAHNFVCWANRLGITNIVLVATEGPMLDKNEFSQYSVTILNAHEFKNIKGDATVSSVELQQRVITDALEHGVSVLLAKPDEVWLNDAHRLVIGEHDVIVSENEVLFLRSTLANTRRARSDRACWKNPTSLECWDIETKYVLPKHTILSSFSDVKWDKQNLHLPSIFRYSGQLDAMRQRVWALDDQSKCTVKQIESKRSVSDSASLHKKRFRAATNHIHYSDLRPTVIRVNIITQSRAPFLKRCLSHLEQALGTSLRLAHFDLEVDLHIIVNSYVQSPEIVKGNRQVHQFLKEYVWPFGNLERRNVSSSKLLDTWTAVEPLKDPSSMLLVLEDDIFVSQYIFEYISAAHHKYTVHEDDPNLIGFSTHFQEYTCIEVWKSTSPCKSLWWTHCTSTKYRILGPLSISRTLGGSSENGAKQPHKKPTTRHASTPLPLESVVSGFLQEKSYYMLHYTDSGRQGFSTHMRARGLHFKGSETPTNPLFVSYEEVFKIISSVASTSLDDMRLLNTYNVEYPDAWTLQTFEKIRKSFPEPSNVCDPGYKPKPQKKQKEKGIL